MSQVKIQLRINAAKEKVWETLNDLQGVQGWNPNVDAAHYTSEIREGVGASRHCDLAGGTLAGGGTVEESVIEVRPQEVLTISLDEGAPFKKAHGRWTIQGDDGATDVTVTLEYEMKFGPIGWLMDRLLVNSQLRKALRHGVAGLKYHLETGQVVGTELPEHALAAM